MGYTFFVSWELWQQMTFCLGSAIVLVIFLGMIKLALINRRVAKHKKLDMEKKSRLSEMRSSGLGRGDIPFGVRAIQNGVEVEGIWISRPSTPTAETPLVVKPSNFGSIQTPKVRTPTDGGRIPIVGAVEVRSLTPRTNGPRISPPSGSLAGAGGQATYKPKHAPGRPSPRSNESYNADALDSLEGSSGHAGAPQTYMPSRHEGAGRTGAGSEYPDYFSQNNSRDPFATPEPSDNGSPEDHPSPIEQVYAGEVHSSHNTRRGNGGYEPAYSTADASRLDLESGDYSRPSRR